MAKELVLNIDAQNEVTFNLYDIERAIGKADCIMNGLFSDEFEQDTITMKDLNDSESPNHLAALMLIVKYDEIKTKLDIVYDYIFQVKKTIKPLSEVFN